MSEPKYPKDFKHFDYVNANAPKKGTLKSSEIGSFDSLNPFIQKGNAESNVLNLVYDTLGVSAADEIATEYALIAQKFIIAKDKKSMIVVINPNARFSDGAKVSAHDVKFSFDSLTSLGRLEYQRYYADVQSALVLDEHTIRFDFKTAQNTELPLILAQLPIMPRHIFMTNLDSENFSESDYKNAQFNTINEKILESPIGSGAYVVESFDLGRKIVFKRNENYWAKEHPTRKGFFNFDFIEVEYYKEPVVQLQAFLSGAQDYKIETSAKVWAMDYKTNSENLKKEIIPNKMPSTLQGFFFNTRFSHFKDVRVREAIFYAFDFEWSNKNLFFEQYERTKNYFDNSIFASSGVPSGVEREILQNLDSEKSVNFERILNSEFVIPVTNGARLKGQNLRENLKYAQEQLVQAGYKSKNGVLTNDKGQKLEFEILINYEGFERICLPFIQNLKKLGIIARVQKVDDTQYINRVKNGDYEMIIGLVGQSLNPGNEQRFYWGSQSANGGGRNYAKIEDENVDNLIEKIILESNQERKIALVRALDRVLLWGFYVIPHFHSKGYRVAFWSDRIEMPDVGDALYGFEIYNWWAK